jgi:hypothetical protein
MARVIDQCIDVNFSLEFTLEYDQVRATISLQNIIRNFMLPLDPSKPLSIFRYNFNEMIEEENLKPYLIGIICNSCDSRESQFGCRRVYRIDNVQPFTCLRHESSSFSILILPVLFDGEEKEKEIFSRKMNSWLSFWRWMLYLE